MLLTIALSTVDTALPVHGNHGDQETFYIMQYLVLSASEGTYSVYQFINDIDMISIVK